jgi:hypothetical protein
LRRRAGDQRGPPAISRGLRPCRSRPSGSPMRAEPRPGVALEIGGLADARRLNSHHLLATGRRANLATRTGLAPLLLLADRLTIACSWPTTICGLIVEGPDDAHGLRWGRQDAFLMATMWARPCCRRRTSGPDGRRLGRSRQEGRSLQLRCEGRADNTCCEPRRRSTAATFLRGNLQDAALAAAGPEGQWAGRLH